MNLVIPTKLVSSLQENSGEEDLGVLTELISFHNEHYIRMHKPLPARPPRLLGQNGLHFLQSSLFRSRALIDGYFQSLDANNPLLCALSARAHFEITGAVAYFYKKLKSFYNGSLTNEQIDDSLRRLSLGMRSKGESEHAPDPIGVMTLIDAADNEYHKLTDDRTLIFRGSYDILSEFCHPNSFGLQMGSSINKVAIVRYHKYFNTETPDDYFFNNFVITASAFMFFYKKAFGMLKENEDSPIIFR